MRLPKLHFFILSESCHVKYNKTKKSLVGQLGRDCLWHKETQVMGEKRMYL